MWTKKHDAFCVKNKSTAPSLQLIWRWLMAEGQGEAIEIDLKDFKHWIANQGIEPFCNRTLKRSFARLEELGVIVVERTYTWHIHIVVVRPLAWITTDQKNDQDEQPMSRNQTPIPQFVSDKIEQQQQEKELRSELKEWGIEYRDRDWKKIIKHGVENIRAGLQHLLIRATSTEITNPPGWLRRCIQGEWWQDKRSSLILSLSQLAYG